MQLFNTSGIVLSSSTRIYFILGAIYLQLLYVVLPIKIYKEIKFYSMNFFFPISYMSHEFNFCLRVCMFAFYNNFKIFFWGLNIVEIEIDSMLLGKDDNLKMFITTTSASLATPTTTKTNNRYSLIRKVHWVFGWGELKRNFKFTWNALYTYIFQFFGLRVIVLLYLYNQEIESALFVYVMLVSSFDQRN